MPQLSRARLLLHAQMTVVTPPHSASSCPEESTVWDLYRSQFIPIQCEFHCGFYCRDRNTGGYKSLRLTTRTIHSQLPQLQTPSGPRVSALNSESPWNLFQSKVSVEPRCLVSSCKLPIFCQSSSHSTEFKSP